MIDTITYGLTKDLPSGPIFRPEEPLPFDDIDDEGAEQQMGYGTQIGGIIALFLLIATGAYLAFAI